jgi:glutamyl-tRNA synthetase
MIKDGFSIFLTDLNQLGYLPEATVNWIALMGWSFDDHTEFFTMPDLIEKFSMDRLNPSPAAINFTKYDHFNGLHIRNLAQEDLTRRLKPFLAQAGYTVDDTQLAKITPIVQERLGGLDEIVPLAGFFFQEMVHPTLEDLVAKKLTARESAEAARKALAVLESLPGEITPATAEPPLRMLVEELGLSAGQVFGILRVAVTGQTVSPPLFESMEIIGRQKTLERILSAIQMLEAAEEQP